MNSLVFLLASPQGGEGGSPFMMFVPIIMVFVVFYLLLIRPQQRKQREHQKLISELRKGERVVTNGGIFGIIADVKEHIVVLRISEEVKIEVAKSAIATVIEKKKD